MQSQESLHRRRQPPRALPIEVQRCILEMLPPRSMACVASVCALWRSLVSASATLTQRLAVSRAVGQAYVRFFRDDYGERFLDVRSWTVVELHAVSAAAQPLALSLRRVMGDWFLTGVNTARTVFGARAEPARRGGRPVCALR